MVHYKVVSWVEKTVFFRALESDGRTRLQDDKKATLNNNRKIETNIEQSVNDTKSREKQSYEKYPFGVID